MLPPTQYQEVRPTPNHLQASGQAHELAQGNREQAQGNTAAKVKPEKRLFSETQDTPAPALHVHYLTGSQISNQNTDYSSGNHYMSLLKLMDTIDRQIDRQIEQNDKQLRFYHRRRTYQGREGSTAMVDPKTGSPKSSEP